MFFSRIFGGGETIVTDADGDVSTVQETEQKTKVSFVGLLVLVWS